MQIYTLEQAAEKLQIHPDTARRLARDGRLQGSKIGRNWRFTDKDIEHFLEKSRPTAHPVQQDPQSWQCGYQAGLSGEPPRPPPGVDTLAWLAGKIEGDADRQRGIDRRKISAR